MIKKIKIEASVDHTRKAIAVIQSYLKKDIPTEDRRLIQNFLGSLEEELNKPENQQRFCEHCNKPLPSEKQSGVARRFCGDRCRVAIHRKKKREAAMLPGG